MHDTISVSDIMIEDVVTASPDATATEAATVIDDDGTSVLEGDAVVLIDELPPAAARERDAAATGPSDYSVQEPTASSESSP